MSVRSVGERKGDVVVGRVVRDSMSTMTTRRVSHELSEERVCYDGRVVLFPLSPN